MMQHPETIPVPPLSWAAFPLPEASQQAIRDLENVKRVSASLFPRNLPQIGGLACAAVCKEARQAGGDYYDFFDRGAHRLGFAIGDVSGKGIASAIVRATLQAGLRTLSTTGCTDLGRTLAVVNRLLLESAPEEMYATLFLAEYDERSRRLQYVNCGHPAPIVYGRNGLSRLQPNATVLGLFDDWECSITEVRLAPGDTVLLYTDGASEAMNNSGEQFGEDRLVEVLQTNRHLSLPAILQKCLDQVRGFGSESERDDLSWLRSAALRVRELSIAGCSNVVPVRGKNMQYLLLIYDDDKRCSNGYSAAEPGEYRTFGKEFTAAIQGGHALQPTATAAPVRVRDGELLTADGPFAETRNNSPATTSVK